jgi:porin
MNALPRNGRRGLPGRCAVLAALAGLALASRSVAADGPQPPVLTYELRNTADVWRNLSGGEAVGYTSLDKLQIGATLDGEPLGAPGFKAHAFVFKTNGETLSRSRTGDLQTASNIEALSVTRLFSVWVEQRFGPEGPGGVTARLGLMDLNDTFDSIGTAGLFLNSSHGIGPDLSRSGVNGPSIFPVSSAGLQLTWSPKTELTLRAAALDGVAGDPAHPKAFSAVRLRARDGALLIAQADYAYRADAQASLGVWTYTRLPGISAPRPGIYGFIDGPAPFGPKSRAWIRAGVADGRAQPVSAYLGGGVVWSGLLPGRGGDQLGLAVARASISAPVRRDLGLPRAETTWEATYSIKLGDALRLQPDIQYIQNPSGAATLADAFAVGLRVVVDFKGSLGRSPNAAPSGAGRSTSR